MRFLRHIIGLIVTVLLSALSVVAIPTMPAASDHAEFFPHQQAVLVEHTDVHFAARAPPIAAINAAFTGVAVAEHGNGFVTHVHEIHVVSLGSGADFIAPNRIVPDEILDQAGSVPAGGRMTP